MQTRSKRKQSLKSPDDTAGGVTKKTRVAAGALEAKYEQLREEDEQLITSADRKELKQNGHVPSLKPFNLRGEILQTVLGFLSLPELLAASRVCRSWSTCQAIATNITIENFETEEQLLTGLNKYVLPVSRQLLLSGEMPFIDFTDALHLINTSAVGLRKLAIIAQKGKRVNSPHNNTELSLSGLNHLSHLFLFNLNLTSQQFGQICDIVSLTELQLYRVAPGSYLDYKQLGRLTGLTHLRLDLEEVRWTEGFGETTYSWMDFLASLNQLTHLEFRNVVNYTGDASFLTLVPQLEVLDLNYTALNDACFTNISALSNLRVLRCIDKTHDFIPHSDAFTAHFDGEFNATVAGVARVAALTDLEHLEVGYPFVRPEGLALLHSLTRLQTLYIHSNTHEIDKDMEFIEGVADLLGHLPELSTLRLDDFGETVIGLCNSLSTEFPELKVDRAWGFHPEYECPTWTPDYQQFAESSIAKSRIALEKFEKNPDVGNFGYSDDESDDDDY